MSLGSSTETDLTEDDRLEEIAGAADVPADALRELGGLCYWRDAGGAVRAHDRAPGDVCAREHAAEAGGGVTTFVQRDAATGAVRAVLAGDLLRDNTVFVLRAVSVELLHDAWLDLLVDWLIAERPTVKSLLVPLPSDRAWIDRVATLISEFPFWLDNGSTWHAAIDEC